jgi:Domain of unknown function (DUF4157)
MKEYEQRGPDSAEQDAAQGVGPTKTRRSSSSGSGEHLSHPANAEPLADLLGQLQHDYGNAYVQRVVSGLRDERADELTAHDAAPKPESVQSLDSATRGEMESAFGESLGDVRLHTGEQAEETARGLGARAFTRGRDIYFGKGAGDLSTRDGRETLAHELTHVMQQREGAEAANTSSREDSEKEAEETARLVTSGHAAQVKHSADASSVYRQSPSASTPQPAPAQTPGPAPPPASAGFTLNLTPALGNAMVDLSVERRWLTQRITLYVALDALRWAWIAEFLADHYPAALQELLAQRPRGMNREDFLRTACRQIWNHVGPLITQQIEQRMQREKRFRERVDRERDRVGPLMPIVP